MLVKVHPRKSAHRWKKLICPNEIHCTLITILEKFVQTCLIDNKPVLFQVTVWWQAITWTHDDPDLRYQMTSLDNSELDFDLTWMYQIDV